MSTYKIVRKYFQDKESKEIKTGLTLEKAKEHCNDPETSSKTCSTLEGMERTRKYGPWFDCYYEEE